MSDTERGCILPAAQAGAVFVLAGLLTLAVCQWRGWSPWLALAVGSLAGLITFSSGVMSWRRAEFGAPVYYPPPPPPAPDHVRVELTRPLDGQAKQTQITNLPASYDQLRELADGVLRGAPMSEVTWSGPGRPFTRAEFAALRAELLRRGWCDWRRADSPGQGVILTGPGRAVIRSFASNAASPLPQTGDD